MIYFAYGSNLNPGQMFERCPSHETIGVARLPRHSLTFPRFSSTRGCATAGFAPHPTESVWGVLYRLGEDDLPILHFHEGYDPYGPSDGNRHNFEEVRVVRPGAQAVQTVMTYIAVADGTRERPSAHYLDLIIDGARYHGLPRAWIQFLQRVPRAD